jgi:deoxyribodipyrimidine photo-lyase
MIHAERLQTLNKRLIPKGRYVLYWMQASQRAQCNHAFEHAVEWANERQLPLVVFVGLTPKFPCANVRHYRFLLEGLREIQRDCEQRGAAFVVQMVDPAEGAIRLSKDAAVAVVDCGYLRLQRQWRKRAAREMPCPFIQAESDVVVPVEAVYPKKAWSAAVLRPRIHALLDRYLVPVLERDLKVRADLSDLPSIDLTDVDEVLRRLGVKAAPAMRSSPAGGATPARDLLRIFIEKKLVQYAVDRNDPTIDGTSRLSPYLHFGQISALEVALAVRSAGAEADEAFLEELIVRRELAMNFAFYELHYDAYEGVPEWARKTLARHARDRRESLYSRRQLEAAHTHDPYWNAAQREMVLTGHMHGTMRMYWGKKILEWSTSPEEAFKIAIELNDRYELDGRDPNGFAGVAWCFGLHDRPWKERKVFGNVRYMNAAGLKRKFDADAYVQKIDALPKNL